MITKIRIKKQQNNNNVDTKPLNVFDYLKSLSQKEKDLIGEIEDADNDTDDNKLLFISSNKKKIDFNTFKMPLNFLSNIFFQI